MKVSEHTRLGERLAADIRALAAIERPPASSGEEEAARWVASRFQQMGLEASIDEFRFNPDYFNVWAAHGLAAAGATALAFTGRRSALVGAAIGTLTAASFAAELNAGQRPARWLFPVRDSFNVLARLPNPDAKRVLVVSAHHDAPPSGLLFHPALAPLRALAPESPPPLRVPLAAMVAVAAGSVARALGGRGGLSRYALLGGAAVSLGLAALMWEIGRRRPSPGANDDASGVAVVLALAEDLLRIPPPGLEVWFLTTGSEEGILGGMQAFLRRHEGELRERRPFVLNLEMLGSGTPVYLEGEGFLTRHGYHRGAVRLAAEVARRPEFAAVRPLRSAPYLTDALVASRRGIPALTVASVNSRGYVPHYHWSTDTPENVDTDSVEAAYAFCRSLIDRLAETGGLP